MLSDAEREMYTAQAHPVVDQTYAPDRETTELFPYFERPVTVMYPYERLEEMEPWLFVPGILQTAIECAFAALISIVLTPTPIFWISFSWGALSI